MAWGGSQYRKLAVCACAFAASIAFAAGSAIEAARDLAGNDPEAARARLAAIREQAVVSGDLVQRLMADEADCRLLTDIDPALARRAAEAGAAAAGGAANDAVRLPALRLAACGAGALLDVGRNAEGSAELERIVAQTESQPALAAARAMALLERGLHRSRRGDLVPGQADLLAACGLFQALQLQRDGELCDGHLANHYKRMGDTDEALRLLEPLLQSARRRQARIDIGVYVFAIGQVRHERREWEPALRAFDEAARIGEAAHDTLGVAYAEHGSGLTLLRMGRAAEALPHAEHALALLADGSDPAQALRVTLLRASVLTALQRPADALHDLVAQQAAADALNDEPMRAEWRSARAAADAALGHWHDAYAALDEARTIEHRLQEQRLSQQSARLRMAFNRARDSAEMQSLRHVNEQGERLRRTQALAIALFVLLLGLALAFAVRKLRQARRLHRLAMVDELTGLPNRRAVLDALAVELKSARRLRRPLSVLVIDVDRFKAVNDSHGHAVGDEVLRHLAAQLAASLRAQDRVGRLGGEEFLAVLPDTSSEHARAIAERMRHSVTAADCMTSAGPLALTISIGVTSSACGAESAQQLVEDADVALYGAKTGGRNRVCFSEAGAGAPA